MIAALADEASAEVATVDPARAVPWRRPARWCALGLAVLGLSAAPAVLWPATYGILARRFLTPWADLERIGRFVITVAPGDRIAAIGADLTVGAQVRPRFGNLTPPESAWLEWTEAGGDGAWHRVAMPVEGSGPLRAATRSFAVTLPRLTGSLTYRVASGSALSRSYRITAIEPPAVTALAATVEPPAYTRLAVANLADPSRIDAWEGSRVTLNVTASRPVTAIDVEWPAAVENEKETPTTPGARKVAATRSADGKSGTATLAAEASGSFAVTLARRARPEQPARGRGHAAGDRPVRCGPRGGAGGSRRGPRVEPGRRADPAGRGPRRRRGCLRRAALHDRPPSRTGIELGRQGPGPTRVGPRRGRAARPGHAGGAGRDAARAGAARARTGRYARVPCPGGR